MRTSVVAVAAVASFTLTGCFSNDTADFKSEAEDYVESDDFAGTVEEELGETVDFTDAVCEEPANTDADTTYGCRATNSDGVVWNIEVEIRDENELAVIGVAPQE